VFTILSAARKKRYLGIGPLMENTLNARFRQRANAHIPGVKRSTK